MNLSVLRSERFVICVETASVRWKLFQILCRPDGTIFVTFPYYKDASATLAEGTLKAAQRYPINLNVAGPVTMHRVKYTHHVDGEAHFSQDGKILTKVRRRANTISGYAGHLFTVQLQGLSDFQLANDRDTSKRGRQLVSLRLAPEPAALKLVGHLYSSAHVFQRLHLVSDAGPWIRVVRGQKEYAAVLLAAGEINDPTGRILTVSFEEVPIAFHDKPSGFLFIGGFDAPETALDHEKDTSFLVLLSPTDVAQAIETFGTVDLT